MVKRNIDYILTSLYNSIKYAACKFAILFVNEKMISILERLKILLIPYNFQKIMSDDSGQHAIRRGQHRIYIVLTYIYELACNNTNTRARMVAATLYDVVDPRISQPHYPQPPKFLESPFPNPSSTSA